MAETPTEYSEAEQHAIEQLEARLAALFLEDPFWIAHPDAVAIAAASVLANVLRVVVLCDGSSRLPWVSEMLGQVADSVRGVLAPPPPKPPAPGAKWH